MEKRLEQIFSKLRKDCDFTQNPFIVQNVFELEAESLPEEWADRKYINLSNEEVRGNCSKDFLLIFEQRRAVDMFHYMLFCPAYSCFWEGWYTTSAEYQPINKIINNMKLPFKVKYKGFKTWLNG